MTWDEILEALRNLPSIPLDANEQLETILRENFNFYDDSIDQEQ